MGAFLLCVPLPGRKWLDSFQKRPLFLFRNVPRPAFLSCCFRQPPRRPNCRPFQSPQRLRHAARIIMRPDASHAQIRASSPAVYRIKYTLVNRTIVYKPYKSIGYDFQTMRLTRKLTTKLTTTTATIFCPKLNDLMDSPYGEPALESRGSLCPW